jgi:hypothetical protein
MPHDVRELASDDTWCLFSYTTLFLAYPPVLLGHLLQYHKLVIGTSNTSNKCLTLLQGLLSAIKVNASIMQFYYFDADTLHVYLLAFWP